MATFKICVFKHQQREDGKYPVSIRLTNNRQSAYINTGHYVVRKQIAKDFKTLKDTTLVRRIDRDIEEYEKIILRAFGANLKRITAKELVRFIEKQSQSDGGNAIDFIAFSRRYIDQLKAKGRTSYAQGFESVIRALCDYFDREAIYVREVTGKSLQDFAEYLRSERTMTRTNQYGNKYQITRPPVKEQTAADYLGALQTLFRAACDEFNGEDEAMALITHNPFRKQIIKVTEEPEKRSLQVADLVKIIDYQDGKGRLGLARDVFLLSFYLIGMNTADLYGAEGKAISDGRINYCRQKTTTRRKDEARISVKLEPEVMQLVEKYRDPSQEKAFIFSRQYSDYRTFNANINKGLKQLAATLDLTPALSTYYARHTWATIADNDCGISIGDIGIALNHVSADHKVTRGYITNDPAKIDHLNRQVIDFVHSKKRG